MKKYHFIQENSSVHRKKVLVIFIVALIFIIFLAIFFYKSWYGFIQRTVFLQSLIDSLKNNLININPFGLFYGHFIGGIFFIPSADELIFYYGLLQGNPIILSFIAALTGYLSAQVLNYIMGVKISHFVLHFVSKKKVYKTKRWINKYGIYGIFFFNILPLPAPLLVFALGVTKYNFRRILIITAIAKILEYLVLIGIFLFFFA